MVIVLILVLVLAIISVVIAFIVGAASGIRGQAGVLAKVIEEADITNELKIALLKALVERFEKQSV